MNDTSFSSQALSAFVFSFSNEVNEERIGKSFKMKNCGVGIHSISKSETLSRVKCTFTLKIKSKSLEDVQASTQKSFAPKKLGLGHLFDQYCEGFHGDGGDLVHCCTIFL